MQSKKQIILLLLLITATPVLWGQESAARHSVDVSWGVVVPFGQKNFMNKPSYIAPSISYQYHVLRILSIGASMNYTYGSASGMTHDRYDEDLIDAFSTRSLMTSSLLAEVRLYPWGERSFAVQPYIGVASGINYALHNITGDAISTTVKSSWAEAYTAQIGARYTFGEKGSYIDCSAQWRYQGNELRIMNIQRQQEMVVSVGYGLMF